MSTARRVSCSARRYSTFWRSTYATISAMFDIMLQLSPYPGVSCTWGVEACMSTNRHP